MFIATWLEILIIRATKKALIAKLFMVNLLMLNKEATLHVENI